MTTWNPGDLAQSLNGDWFDRRYRLSPGPKRNQILMVADVFVYPNGEIGLSFPSWPGLYYMHEYFRKLGGNAPEIERRVTQREPCL